MYGVSALDRPTFRCSLFWLCKGKTDTLNDPRWDYQLAVSNGYLPSVASEWDTTACTGYATS